MNNKITFIRGILPGLLLAAGLAALAIGLARYLPFAGSATLALLLGIVLGNAGPPFSRLVPGLSYAEKKVLEISIVLIGFGLNIRIFSQLGFSIWVFIGASVVVVMGVAFLIGKAVGLTSRLSALLGAGSAICGSAAIGAVAPLIQSTKEETGLAIGIINALGTVGLLLLPAVITLMDYSDDAAGLMIGGVLQSMGHVAGAAFAVNDNIGTLATVIKMGRIVLIIPLLIILYFAGRGKSTEKKRGLKGFPLFILFFLASIGIAQIGAFPQALATQLSQAGNYLLIVAMVGIGFKIRIRPLFNIAGRALASGALIFVFQILLYLVYLNFKQF
ncbi:MAG: putative sulfate exporter family transporter [Bacteroidia bacterium]